MGFRQHTEWSPPWFLRPPPGTPFPKNFLQAVRKILSRLFRVFVHVYIHHFDRIAQMGSEAHVNTCYKHFYYFVTEFSLIDPKELEPLVSGRGVHHAPCLGGSRPPPGLCYTGCVSAGSYTRTGVARLELGPCLFGEGHRTCGRRSSAPCASTGHSGPTAGLSCSLAVCLPPRT